jgi:serine/threonine-protein kinase
VAAIGEQIASALAGIHAKGIVHRDLKPDNIFVTRQDGVETAKLVDFGIAKFLADNEGLTREGMTMGTPEYMAPEQILTSGKPGTPADLYSLGMLMYECLAGAPAFTATTTARILRGHVSDPVVPPSQLRGEPVPRVLESVVLKCLEKDPAHRFATAGELIDALHADRAVAVVGVKRKRRARWIVPALAIAATAAVLVPALVRETPPARTPVVAPPVVVHAPPPPPAAPATIDVTLMSNPPGAQMYLGDHALGQAPVTTAIAVSSAPVALVAKFADGTSVTQTIVPDRPLPAITFERPKPVTRVARPRPPKKAAPPPASTDREGTIDPFQ